MFHRTLIAGAVLSALAPLSHAQSSHSGIQQVVVTATPFRSGEGDQILTPAKVFELRAINIHTVETLAGLSAAVVAKNHLQSLQAQAVAFLDTANAAAEVAKANAEKQALEDKFAAMQAEIEELIFRLG